MPTFVTSKITPELKKAAKTYFLQQGRSDFLEKTSQTLCTRYLIAKEMKKSWYDNLIPEDNQFQYHNIRYSASHSKDKLIIAFYTKKIAIDMEKIQNKPETYYLERCCKEAIIKYLDLKLDEIKNMQVLQKNTNTASVTYKDQYFKVKTEIKNWYVTALVY